MNAADQARSFWEAGLRVFPLYPFTGTGSDAKCSCGRADCPAAGKHPIASNWQHTPEWDEEQIDTMAEVGQFASGFGVLCRGLLVIDVDARNGGIESFTRLCEEVPEVSAAGMIVETGSGGGSRHLYFRAPTDTAMVQSLARYPGLDFKSSGYVVGPSSRHASGASYSLAYGGPDDIEAAPEALTELLRKPDRHRTEYDGRSIDVSHTDISSMLAHIDPDCGYDTWIRIGMAVHHSTGGTGQAVWDEWSRNGAKYSPAKMDSHWHSFGRSANPVTIGTVIHHAEQGGWVMPVEFTPDQSHIIFADAATCRDEAEEIDISGVDLTCPPGLTGKFAKWIDANSRRARKHISVGAAIWALGSIYALRYTVKSSVRTNTFVFCVAGSRTGKEAVQQGAREIIRAGGMIDAVNGKFKSEQEIIRNLMRHQVAFHIIDEFGLELTKLQNASKRGGAPYLEGITSTMMSVYGKSNSTYDLTGDAKDAARKEAKTRLAQLMRMKEEHEGGPNINRDIEEAQKALDRTHEGLLFPILSVMGMTTPVTFEDLMDFTSGTNGFIGRSLIFVEHETVPTLREGWTETPMPNELRTTLEMLASGGEFDAMDGGRIEYYGDRIVIPDTDQSNHFLKLAARKFEDNARAEKSRSGLESIWLGAYELVEKVSAILAIPEGIRTGEHIRFAYALVIRDTDMKIKSILSNDMVKESPVIALQAKIMNICAGDDGEVISVIARRCRGRKREDVEKVISDMVESGALKSQEREWRGKKFVRYFSA